MNETNMHVVPMPAWCKFTGIARFVIAVLVLAFAAAATGIWGDHTAFSFTLFTACATLVIFAYYVVALSRKPQFYNRWAILGLEIFGVVFWLTSFALCAEWASVYKSNHWWNRPTSNPVWLGPYGNNGYMKQRKANKYKAGVAMTGLCAGFGAIEFVLFTITLIMFSINLHKHRIAGHPSVYGGATKPVTSKSTPATATTTEKNEDAAVVKADPAETTEAHVVKKADAAVV